MSHPHHPRARLLRGRLVLLIAAALSLSAAGVLAVAGPALADANVAIFAPSGPTIGQGYNVGVTDIHAGEVPGQIDTATVTLSGAAATITSAVINGDPVDTCGATGGTQISCTYNADNIPSSPPVKIELTVLPTQLGTVTQTVTLTGSFTGSDSASSTITPVPLPLTVTGVSPASGPTAGGTLVTVTGTGFKYGGNCGPVTDVVFGPVDVTTGITIVSDTTLTLTAPPHAAGTVDVLPQNFCVGSPVTPADQYTYANPSPLTVTGISPASGPQAGGTSVTITGTGFLNNTCGTPVSTVNFGTTAATSVTVNSDTSITAVAPPGTGTVDVTAAASPQCTSPVTTADQYTYVNPAPAVTGVSPASGPLGGGTTVTITGSNFTGATAVDFGGTPATSFTVNSGTSITATAPAGTGPGTVDVTVTTPAGTSTISGADTYTYTFAFTGFQSPVDNPPTLNQVHAGQSIPIKWSLGGNQGLNILAPGSPTATQINCATGAPVNTATLTDTAGGSGLQYDTGSGTYTYVWKTPKADAGTCQELTLTLTDGTTHTAIFQFK